MPSNLLIVAVVLAIAGGVIAYIGDTIGKRLGKRRVSVFGLRPRSTAILISALTGVAIALLSLGAMLILFGQVRDALLHYDDLTASIVEAESQLEQARGQEADSRRATRKAEERQREADGARATAEQSAEQAELDRGAAEDQRARVEGQLEHAGSRLESTRANLGTTEAKLESAEGNLKDLAGNLAGLSEDFLQDTLIGRPTTVLAGDELARVILTSDMGEERIRQALVDLKAEADRVAEQEGAAPLPELDEEARLTVFEYEANANIPEGQSPLTPNPTVRATVYDQAVQQTMAYFEDYDRVIAQVSAAFDSIEGRPVLVKLTGGPIRRLLTKGDELARMEIGSELPYDAIVARLQELADEVGWAALERGMIPTASGSFGRLRPGQIDTLVTQIQSMRGVVPVAVYAATDMENIDELEVIFRLAEQ